MIYNQIVTWTAFAILAMFFTQGVFPNDNDQIPMSVTLMRVGDPPNANISPTPSPRPSSYESDDNPFLLVLKFYESRYF